MAGRPSRSATRSPGTGSCSTADRLPAGCTAAGLRDHDVPDATDFRLVAHPAPPAWTARRGASTRSSPTGSPARPPPTSRAAARLGGRLRLGRRRSIGRGPQTPRQFYGGDLDGIVEQPGPHPGPRRRHRLPDAVLPGPLQPPLRRATFDHVDPLLGGDAALRRLADAAARPGHAADRRHHHQPQRRRARVVPADPRRTRRAGYATSTPDGGYESWYGVPSLPKLNWACAAGRATGSSAPCCARGGSARSTAGASTSPT